MIRVSNVGFNFVSTIQDLSADALVSQVGLLVEELKISIKVMTPLPIPHYNISKQ